MRGPSESEDPTLDELGITIVPCDYVPEGTAYIFNLKDLYKDGYLYKDGSQPIELWDRYPDERDFVIYLQADIDMTQQVYESLYKEALDMATISPRFDNCPTCKESHDQSRQDDGEEA